MTDGDALLAACALTPDEHTPQLVYADWLQENGDEERAELIRLTCELRTLPSKGHGKGPYYVEGLRSRARNLGARLSAWPCPACGGKCGWKRIGGGGLSHRDPICPVCGGAGDVLTGLPLDWRAGYPVAVTVPRMTDAVRREVWYIEDDEPNLPHPATYQPTPRLRALCQVPPWGVPLEAVMVADREPLYGGNDEYAWMRGLDDTATNRLPECIWDTLRDGRHAGLSWMVYPRADAARLALGRAVYQFGSTP